MLVTALNRKIGYDNAAKIAKTRAQERHDAAARRRSSWACSPAEEFDAEVKPEQMVGPSTEG